MNSCFTLDAVTFDTAWLTPTVRSLARAAREECVRVTCPACKGECGWQANSTWVPCEVCDGAGTLGQFGPGTLQVLADALEEAGCDAAGLLAHLRSPGPHARGCRAVDLILAKE
jgi:hypothetical protein